MNNNNNLKISPENNIFICGDYAPNKSFNCEQILKFIKPKDIFILNYEGVSEGVNSEFKKFNYYTPLINNNFLDFLIKNNIKVLANFCNNHTLDYGLDGLNYSIKKLNEIGVICFGIKYEGILEKIRFVDYQNNIHEFQSFIDSNLIKHYKKFNFHKLFNIYENINKMKFAKNSSVYFHGGIEFINYPNYILYKKLKYFYEKNINCFVSHQHVPLFLSNNKIISSFGLGNLAFDYKNHDHTLLTRNSYVVKLNFEFTLTNIYYSCYKNSFLKFKRTIKPFDKFPEFSLLKWSKECYLFKMRRNNFHPKLNSSIPIKYKKLYKIKIYFLRFLFISRNFEYYIGIFFYKFIRFFN